MTNIYHCEKLIAAQDKQSRSTDNDRFPMIDGRRIIACTSKHYGIVHRQCCTFCTCRDLDACFTSKMKPITRRSFFRLALCPRHSVNLSREKVNNDLNGAWNETTRRNGVATGWMMIGDAQVRTTKRKRATKRVFIPRRFYYACLLLVLLVLLVSWWKQACARLF